jgi:hypothetical protein
MPLFAQWHTRRNGNCALLLLRLHAAVTSTRGRHVANNVQSAIHCDRDRCRCLCTGRGRHGTQKATSEQSLWGAAGSMAHTPATRQTQKNSGQNTSGTRANGTALCDATTSVCLTIWAALRRRACLLLLQPPAICHYCHHCPQADKEPSPAEHSLAQTRPVVSLLPLNRVRSSPWPRRTRSVYHSTRVAPHVDASPVSGGGQKRVQSSHAIDRANEG